jgi:hypothetical protein
MSEETWCKDMLVDLNLCRTLTISFNATYMLRDFEDYLFFSFLDDYVFCLFVWMCLLLIASLLFLKAYLTNFDFFFCPVRCKNSL